jgi:hypothetical protein
MAGLWRQSELKDGSYNYIDLLDILEMMTVQAENTERAREQAMREAQNG